MGTFFAFTLYSGVFLLSLYLLYKLLLSREKQIALNRAVLLGCYVLAFAAWPLGQIEWHSAPAMDIQMEGQELDFSLMAVNPIAGEPTQSSFWPQIILWIYFFGASVVLLKTLFSLTKLFFHIQKGTCIREDGYKLIVMPGSDTAPFSFGHYIVMNEVDYATVSETVSAHELAHIRCRHYLDLLLAQTACVLLWYNPASWLMRDELKLIHEYQADAEVVNGGVDEKDYQMLLIRKTVGTRFHTLANNLNHSKLRNRIAMMQKEKSRGVRRLRLFSLALAVALALAVVNIPAVASGLDSMESASLEITNAAEAIEPDEYVAAEYPGGASKLMEYLAMNLRYPESARTENRQGCAVVGFTVAGDGSLSDIRILESGGTDLDNEAMRIVRKMPNWVPSSIDGRPVASEYALPIRFRLMDVEESQSVPHREVTNDKVNWLDEVQVGAYRVKPAAGSCRSIEGKRYKAVAVESDSTVSASSAPKKMKLSPTVATESWKSPKAAQNPHSYIDLKGLKAKLVIGAAGEGDCDTSAYETVRVDGKMLKESRTIDMDSIQSFDEVAPSEQHPNGLLDIKLKKSTPNKKTAAVKSKSSPKTKQMAKRSAKAKQTIKRETKHKKTLALQNKATKKRAAARKKAEIKRMQALKKQQAKAKQKAAKRQQAEKNRQTQKNQDVIVV